MKAKVIDNAKLGSFVIAGLLFLILTLYMIGRNRNLLGSTFTLKAVVTNVNGLVPGNNVRFKGIDVGTVKSITIANDSSIIVTMIIDDKVKLYVKQNAIASIGTDGLMGNRLININSQPGAADLVRDGSTIQSRIPIETDEMLRTLNTTNDNMQKITSNLYEITIKLNSSNSLWNLLADTVITKDLKFAVKEFRIAGSNTAVFTQNTKNIISRFEQGHGLAPSLFTDTTLTVRLEDSMNKIQQASEQTTAMMKDLESVIAKLQEGEGTAGLLLADTTLRNKLLRSAVNVEQGTSRFNQNMEALKSNFLFRRYFKKMEREQKKEVSADNN